MFAAAKPEPHPRMLDRFLVIAEGNELAARIVINKVDLVGEAAARERFDMYERIGYPVHYTGVKAGDRARRDSRARSSAGDRCSPDRRASESRRCSTRCSPARISASARSANR